MKMISVSSTLLVALLTALSPADAQIPREDVIWARATSDTS